jgi:nucleoside phosphorylase/CheY-like chemotaxis protein
MLKILIVEDNSDKLRNISETLENHSIDGDMVDHAIDYHSALKFLKNTLYDLLIIDIGIPIRRSGAVDMEGGVKLLQEVLQRDHYIKPSYIVGLTALDIEFSNAARQFDHQSIFVIKYSEGDEEWKNALINCIDQRIAAKSAVHSQQICFNYDIAIITAVDVEFKAVMALSETWVRVSHPADPSPYFEGTLEGNGKKFKVVAVCAPQMGMNSSAIFSMKLIYNFRPKYLFMTGIAASLKDSADHGFGDILVVDESWDGGAGKLVQTDDGEAIFQQTARHLRIDTDLAEKIRGYQSDKTLLRSIKDNWKFGAVPNTELTLHLGSVTSVAGVIGNEAVIKKLKEHDRKLLGVEMETYGVYFAAHNCGNPKPLAISFKSISDFANDKKNDLFQAYASYTSAKFMFEFVIGELIPIEK